MNQTVMKSLVSLNEDGEIINQEREVSRFAPVNRVLENVGFYELDSMTVHNKSYLVVFKPEEHDTVKSIILVARIHQDEFGESVIDMIEADLESLKSIANRFLRVKKNLN